MIGAIAGDIVGSPYEGRAAPEPGFPLFPPAAVFTDDTVCTVAVAEAAAGDGDFARALRRWARRYPDAGYGARFKAWAWADDAPAPASNGNGAAMRAAPIGWVAASAERVLALARDSAKASHDHPEAIAGAQAVALMVFRARQGTRAADMRAELARRFGWTLPTAIADVAGITGMDVRASSTVPPSLAIALAAWSWEEAVRAAVALGGDTDTQACMAGAVADARFGLPDAFVRAAEARLDRPLRKALKAFARFRPGRLCRSAATGA